MPPLDGVAGRMVLSFFTSEKIALNSNVDWNAMGKWYSNLIGERIDASPEVKQQVAALASSLATPLQKMQAVAGFVQQDIRYVAIELGVGGYNRTPRPRCSRIVTATAKTKPRSSVLCFVSLELTPTKW